MASTTTTTAATTAAATTTAQSPLFISDTTELQKVFDRFDANGDGKISRGELTGVLRALGSDTSPEELDRMMEAMDSDRDGFVNLDEFAAFCNTKTDEGDTGSNELKEAFEMYDQDKNGLISASELHLVLSRLGEKCSVHDCERMIKSIDSDGDGNVDFEEFRKMMTKTSS